MPAARPGHPYVLVARDLAPADTLLDLSRCSRSSLPRAAPRATPRSWRARGIPAVVGCADALSLVDGDVVVVDAARRPRPRLGARAGSTARGPRAPAGPHRLRPPRAAAGERQLTQRGRGRRGGRRRGRRAAAHRVSAPPTPGLHAFAAHPVLVRVLDAGADKPLPVPQGASRTRRSARAGCARCAHGVLDSQLAAIAAAAAQTREVSVMAPMVTDPADAAWFVARARAHGLEAPGVMVEIPSAALTRLPAASVSFASVGTNDLTQYTLAADRLVGSLGHLQDPWHPAVLRLVELVGAAGALTGKPVGVCGEAAADPLLACVLVGLGASSLSMAPGAWPRCARN